MVTREFLMKTSSQHPLEAPLQLRVDGLDVLQRDGLVEQHLVEGQRETTVDVVAVEHRQPDHTPNKVEVGEVLLGKRTHRLSLKREWIYMGIYLLFNHLSTNKTYIYVSLSLNVHMA